MTVVGVAGLADLPAVIASAAALFAEDGGVRDPHMDTTWPERAGEPWYRALIEGADSVVFLAYPDPRKTQVIGHLTGKVAPPDAVRREVRVATLQSLRVDAAYRRRGVAHALVDAFVEWASGLGADEAAVSAYASNSGALSLYRGAGFEEYDITLHRPLR